MRILVVEDDHALARELKQRLRREGYAVDTAENGIDAEHLGNEEGYDHSSQLRKFVDLSRGKKQNI